MDSLGDYIYLIILAIAGVSGLLKKKKEVSGAGSAPTSTKKSWEDVIRDLIPIEEEQEKKTVFASPVTNPVSSTVNQPEYLSYETAADPMVLRAKKPVSQMVSVKNPVATGVKTDTTNKFLAELRLETVDDAKRAFVYSEIFNRKY